MSSPLRDAMMAMAQCRQANADVFTWPKPLENFLYIHEETAEWARAIMNLLVDHLRGHPIPDAQARAKARLEAGQTIMMVLTQCYELSIDPDDALATALEEVNRRCTEKRKAKAKET